MAKNLTNDFFCSVISERFQHLIHSEFHNEVGLQLVTRAESRQSLGDNLSSLLLFSHLCSFQNLLVANLSRFVCLASFIMFFSPVAYAPFQLHISSLDQLLIGLFLLLLAKTV